MIDFANFQYQFSMAHGCLECIAKNDDVKIQFSIEIQESTLTQEKVKELLKNVIQSQKIDLSGSQSSKYVFSKEQHKINEIDSSIVLEILNIRPNPIVGFFRYLISLVFDSKSAFTYRTTQEFESFLTSLPQKIVSKIDHCLHLVTKEEKDFLHFIGTRIAFDDDEAKTKAFLEILNGGYVQFEDNGKTYQEWKKSFHSKHFRVSSHESDARQYAVRGPLVKELLFSKKTIKEKDGSQREVTWLQLERYPVNFLYALPHLISWMIYKATGENQGPFGMSSFTERNPLSLRVATPN